MAFKLGDKVKETTTTTGTGAITLLGTVSGFQTFGSVLANGDTTFYSISHTTANEWEIGFGTYSTTGPTITRTAVYSSSNSNAAVTFSAGTKNVFITYPSVQSGKRVIVIADATSITPNANTTDVAFQTNTQVAGTLTINAPTGNPIDSQKLMIKIKSTNIQTYGWNAIYRESNDLAKPTGTTGSGKTDYVGFVYNAADNKWDLVAKILGYT